MDVDNNIAKKECNSHSITSKYFTAETAMDESLSDFQETKKTTVGPKTQNKVRPKRNAKKLPKKIRGQKDIKTALKGKQELELYSKDFDKVCKKSGIDVDSEQLQLAIALSKSLQNEPSTSTETLPTKAISSRNRLGIIRSTLQEYGFKVPDIKINSTKRKHKKHYKLILTSDTIKKEIIANKYSKVIFENISINNLNRDSIDSVDPSLIPLFYLASSVDYNTLKSQNIFYLDNLIERQADTGNSLRDWSKIPGRAVSPKLFEPRSMNFSEIECSQEEIDVILSGSLKKCQYIYNDKHKRILICEVNSDISSDKQYISNEDKPLCNDDHDKALVNIKDNAEQPDLPITQGRCDSPDIFDDEGNSIVDISSETVQDNEALTNVNKDCDLEVVNAPTCFRQNSGMSDNLLEDNSVSNKSTRKSHDYMELTECIHIQPNNQDVIVIDDFCITGSQKSDVIKRKSNDFMDITECVGRSRQIKSIETHIDLTQIVEEEIDTNNVSTVKNVVPKSNLSNIGNNKTRDDVDLDMITVDKEYTVKLSKEYKSIQDIDLTQSSNSNDELPFVSLDAKRSLDDVITIDINDGPIPKDKSTLGDHTEEQIDLTQYDEDDVVRKPTQTLFDEFLFNHSDNNEQRDSGLPQEQINTNNPDDNLSHVILCENNVKESEDAHINNEHEIRDVTAPLSPLHKDNNNSDAHDIDLTQDSDYSEKSLSPCSSQIESILKESSKDDIMDDNSISLENGNTSTNSQSYSSLGKKGDISIDYDELSKTKNDISKSLQSSSEITAKSDENHAEMSQNNDLASCSQSSEVFYISDGELDYSMHKSRIENPDDNFALGGLSIMDELSNLGSFKKSVGNKEPENVMKENLDCLVTNQKQLSPIKHRRITEIVTPQKPSSSNIHTVVTPKNTEFVIKTTNVTPMQDYNSMSTPEIHSELDKYGIKPLKRKTGIKLLTHIYNQTHPIIEVCTDELASPPKRRKISKQTSPQKKLSPRKLMKSPKKVSVRSSQNDPNLRGHGSKASENYKDSGRVTQSSKEQVLINAFEGPTSSYIDCKPEDWVFQKREKAKVHSCRVPLHLAFYNYVMSRRDLREAILCYKPVNIDDIHKDLVKNGHRYDPKDLLKFMDKKCITVKTTDNDGRNNKR